jgi:hypothetical protein
MTTISIVSQSMNISGSISFPDNPSPHYASVTAMIASCIKSGNSLRCNIEGKPYMIGADALRDSVISFDL